MLLTHIGEGHAVLQSVSNPYVRLIYDTGHVQIMDGDLLLNMHDVWPSVRLFQIADNSHRTEPGTGEINFQNVLKELVCRDYDGLVELEHPWSYPHRESEQKGLAWLRAIDPILHAARAGHVGQSTKQSGA